MTKRKKWIVMGVLMATFLSLLLGCDIDKRATNPILTRLSEKYGKTFTVTTLGDRIGKNTATAYVCADDDPDMRFTARVDPEGNLVYEDYAFRTVCRQVEDLLAKAFNEQGMDAVSFCRLTPFNNDIEPGTSPVDYIRIAGSETVYISLVIRDNGDLSGESILAAYRDLQHRLNGLRIATTVYVVSPADYDILREPVRMETQSFDAYRLSLYGTKDPIREVILQVTDGNPSRTAAELEALLTGEGK